jgi:hypothetical protein
MRILRRLLAVSALMVLSQGDSSAQAAAGAEQQVRAYFEAIRGSDYRAAAGMMHTSALAEIRELVDLMVAVDPSGQLAGGILGPGPTDYRAMSDVDAFAGFLRFSMTQQPMLIDLMRSMVLEIIGPVAEGDTLHVVARVGMEVDGMPIRQMQVTSVAREGGEWRVLLTGEIAGLVAGMRQQLGGGVN